MSFQEKSYKTKCNISWIYHFYHSQKSKQRWLESEWVVGAFQLWVCNILTVTTKERERETNKILLLAFAFAFAFAFNFSSSFPSGTLHSLSAISSSIPFSLPPHSPPLFISLSQMHLLIDLCYWYHHLTLPPFSLIKLYN